jgi:hypothetical protein
MPEGDVELPMDWRLIQGVFPVGFDRQLGYRGPARFVAFWWNDDEDDVACNDGKTVTASTGQWEFWTTTIAPNSPFFRGRFGAHLGATEEPATHVLVWDRLRQLCYIAEKESAEEFLAGQSA